MSKTLYDEALADVKQLKEVAESNAKRAIIEAVTPRIKDLIERQLLGETSAFENPGDNPILEDEIEEVVEEDALTGALGVTHPEQGGSSEATGDGSTASGEEPVLPPGESNESYEMTSEGVEALLPFSNHAKPFVQDRVELKVYELAEKTNELVIADNKTKATEGFVVKINETIKEIEDMYSYVQESDDPSRKSKLENKLEKCFSVLTAVKETTMRMKDLVSEANLEEDKEVTLKVTGLPDDVELEKLNIDIISDEEEAPEAMPAMEPGAEEAPAPQPEEEMSMEGEEEMDDDDVVEISESMLKAEIARMKKLSEGEAMSADILDDFGGGKDEGDQFEDGEVSTADDKLMGEADMEEVSKDELDEKVACMDEDEEESDEDELDEKFMDLKGKMDDDHLPESKDPKKYVAEATKVLDEARQAVAVTEKRFAAAKSLYSRHKGGKHSKRAYALAERAYKAHKTAKACLVEATKHMVAAKKNLKESLKNSDSKQLAESKAAVESLRKQLVETNLLNAKLIQANKLLQMEGLSGKQKVVIIEKLDEAQNLREVKLVYESLVKALSGDKKSMKEGVERSVVGSSSRSTRSSGAPSAPPVVNEGANVETARWAVLAGLSK